MFVSSAAKVRYTDLSVRNMGKSLLLSVGT